MSKPQSQPTQQRYPLIAARVFDTPLLITQSKLLSILNLLGPRLGFDLSAPQVKMMEDYYGPPPDPFEHMEHLQGLGVALEPQGEGHFVGGGVAIIPVTGTLVQRSDMISDASGMTSYGRIERMVDAAQRDSRVRELLYEFDTPGGEVAGAFDFADRLYDMRTHGAKPAVAVVNEMAASAGYLLASGIGDVIVNRTGAVGSIGVVAAHSDYSKAMEKRGVVVTYVYAGDKKIDGNPYAPLSDSAKADWQKEIDSIYAMFIETVSRNMGLAPEKVRATQAAMYTGRQAVDAGLARSVNTFANAFQIVSKRANDPFHRPYGATSTKESAMTKEQLAAQQAADADKAKAAPAAAAPAAEAPAAPAAPAPSATDAATAERARIEAIVNSEEAKGRGKLASHLALKTSMTVDEAKALLAASALEATDKPSPLAAAMADVKNPAVGSGETEESRAAAGKPSIDTAAIYAQWNKPHGAARQ